MIAKLFEPCMMNYKGYDKPIRYTEEFLEELANKVTETNLVLEEHLTPSIGKVSKIIFTDGALFGDVETEEATDNRKYSPYINCTLQEEEDCWLAIKPTGFKDIALTSKPRKPVSLPNTNNGGSNMGNEGNDTTIKILEGQVKDLNKKLVVEENKNKANEEKLKKFDEMEKELKELREWKETNKKIIEEQKPIIDAYKKDQETKRSELIEKLSNGNEELKAQMKDVDLKTLELWDNLQAHEQPPQGISSNNAEGLNEGDGSNDAEKERENRMNAVENAFPDLFNKEE